MITKEQLDSSVEQIIEAMRPRVQDENELARIRDAYGLAYKCHDGQKRLSGEPYIVHPVEVARIVAEDMELDPNCVIAALLHDVVEDTDVVIENVRERYGEDVAYLVDIVTKRVAKSGQSKQVENFRQILGSVHYDIRALMVKLADRLNNMRTLASMPPAKQVKIASETEFFYAPLAGRLGLYRIKSELENLSFGYKCPRDYDILAQQLAEDKEKTADELKAFIAQIEEAIATKGISAHVEIRYRKPYSIWRNMHEENVDFAGVEFKHYIRVIFDPWLELSEKETALAIYSALSDAFPERPGSFINYISRPKENGYESLHVKLLGRIGHWEELHISSQRMLKNSCVGFIAKSTEESKNQWLTKLENMLKDIAEDSTEEFIKGVARSFYNEDCYVLTPQGKVVILPKGASVLDFAYAMHTDIGNHAQYAHVNGKLASVKTILQRGDCVEVFTNEDVQPRPDWLNFVKTFKAEKKINSALSEAKANKLSYIICDDCHPLPGDEVVGFRDENGNITIHKRSCAIAVHQASERGDSIVVVDNFGTESAGTFATHISIVAIDRSNLLHDIVDCISGKGLSISSVASNTEDWIATVSVKFGVHSYEELNNILKEIGSIPGVRDVKNE